MVWDDFLLLESRQAVLRIPTTACRVIWWTFDWKRWFRNSQKIARKWLLFWTKYYKCVSKLSNRGLAKIAVVRFS
jgi:hypothetical protein